MTLGAASDANDACNGIEYSSNHVVSCFEARPGVLTLLVLLDRKHTRRASAQATAR
jgi:hypothetical protein